MIKLTAYNVWRVQRKAVNRLLLFATGETHKLLIDLHRTIAADLAREYHGEWGGLALARVTPLIERAWAKTFSAWQDQFMALRAEAAAIGFGAFAELHDRYVLPAVDRFSEAAPMNPVFDPQLEALLQQAAQRQYGGYNLSQRLWKLSRRSESGIKQVVYNGIANGDSAYRIAQSLEKFLGFGADCPRWTSTRLSLTKGDIAGGRRSGLYSGQACRGQGVAYNALRLGRNEIQIAHAMTTDYLMAQAPFITEEQIVLSPSHPVDDECDQVIANGRDGAGIYPKGTIDLPLHVHCLCFKVAVLMPQPVFDQRMKGWLNGREMWPEMDAYKKLMGGDVAQRLDETAVHQALLRWLSGSLPDLVKVLA